MDIKCRKTVCKFNDSSICCAKKVEVTQEADCATYTKEEGKAGQDFSANMFEAAPDFAPFRHIKNVTLECDAHKCLFNKSGDCVANGITVIDAGADGVCGTFIKK